MTDTDGRFELAGLQPGTWWLMAEHGSSMSASARIELTPDGATDPIYLVLDDVGPNRELDIRVMDGGVDLAGAFVFVETAPRASQRILTTDADGRARLTFEPPLPQMLRLAVYSSAGWAFGDWRPLPDRESGSILVEPALGGGGVLTILAEEPIRHLRLTAPGGWELTHLLDRLGRPLVPAADLTLGIDGLPAGNYRLDLGGLDRPLRIEAGRETRIDHADRSRLSEP